LKAFDQPIPQEKLNILTKTRSNPLAWRGQFSPQLIEAILNTYCLPNSIILDPFAGSGTVLLEDALVILLDIANHKVSHELIQSRENVLNQGHF